MKRFLLISTIYVLSAFGQAIEEDVEDHEELIHPQLRSMPLADLHNQEELNSNYWIEKAQLTIANKIQTLNTLNEKKAKNIILFLGDGMSVHTLAATRAFTGDISNELSFEKFPYFGLSRTYCVNRQVADSACTATAYLAGVKANYGTIGVNAEVPRYDCNKAADKSTHTESIASWAQKAKKSSGLVTTSRVTHASPAGVYAHTANRDWENDWRVKNQNCDHSVNPDIALQLLENPEGRNLKVVFGGGRAEFRNETMRDEQGKRGYRTDGRDLIKEWLNIPRANQERSKYVWSKKGLNEIDIAKTDYVLGLFTQDHNPYHGDRTREFLEDAVPSLSEMTEAAIKILRKEENGFFLFVEGARIDMAHHETFARRALEDTEEFANAVQRAREITSEEDTLIVVTADHAHTMTINGYPSRNADVLQLNDVAKGDDGLPYTVLSYANGPGFYNTYDENGRRDLTFDNLDDPNYNYPATVPLDSETHGGDDVGVYASGPYAHLFTGAYEQNNIPLAMAKAAQIGPYA